MSATYAEKYSAWTYDCAALLERAVKARDAELSRYRAPFSIVDTPR